MSILVLFPVLLAALACGKSVTEWKGTIEEIDGVLVVRNPGEPINKNEKLYAVDTNNDGYYLVKRYKVAWKIGE
jgi:hypothetical protein